MKQYGILAYPAGHSLSPAMHNAAFKALGIDAQYGVFEIPEDGLAEFMEQVKHEPVDGLSVSLPYKEAVIKCLDFLDEDAEKIGAVNTVLNKGGFLWGYNTDFSGAVRAMAEGAGSLSGKTVVVLGAGGAARAIAYGLLKDSARVFIKNRTIEKADKIAAEFSGMFGTEVISIPWDDNRGGDILINATSVWANNPNPEELPDFCHKDFVGSFGVVMDISYGKGGEGFLTPLLKIAESLGKTVIAGDKMLLYQAVEQFKIWTGKEAPLEVMRTALTA
ncbi:MAG: shikimate dehydrogenase [Candidatus Peregrinibacteria bacterium]